MSGIYLHIPFCLGKCSYCDFFSVSAAGDELEGYTELLLCQLRRAAGDGWRGPVETVYFGGGTPSLLTVSQVDRILQAVRREYGLSAAAEITLEANPGSVTPQRLAGYRAAGVNRLSLGLQSCSDKRLALLGRGHSAAEGVAVVENARAAGFDNLALDMLFALPGETPEQLEEELATFLQLEPEHLSCYGLSVEAGTPLHQQVAAGALALPGEDAYADAFLRLDERLSAAGYHHYEIANYARSGRSSRHNRGYWRRRECLGIGAGAHSFRAEGWGQRLAVPADLENYRQRLEEGREPMQPLESFDREGALRETLYLALRTAEGVSDVELFERFGMTLEQAFPGALARIGPWLRCRGTRTSLSPEGWLIYDGLVQSFL